MAEGRFDADVVELAFRLHRNWLKANQNAVIRLDWLNFHEQAARFLGKWHDQS